jgi:hypothetical protein
MDRRNGRAQDPLLGPAEEPPIAAHLITPRALYTHHGIYIGNGRVIHYAGLARGLWRAPVEDVSLERFAHGRAIRIRFDQRIFDCEVVVERARSRLGERCYRILTNNCEHFCAWALCGESQSFQVERYLRMPQIVRQTIRIWLQCIVRSAAKAAAVCSAESTPST